MKLKDLKIGEIYFVSDYAYIYNIPNNIKDIIANKDPIILTKEDKVIYLGFYKKCLQSKVSNYKFVFNKASIPRTDYYKFYVINNNIHGLITSGHIKNRIKSCE